MGRGHKPRSGGSKAHRQLDDYELLAVVLDVKSLSAASRVTGIPVTTIGRRLKKAGLLPETLGRGENLLAPPTPDELWHTYQQTKSLQRTAHIHHMGRHTVRKVLTEVGYLNDEPLKTGPKPHISDEELWEHYEQSGSYAAAGREVGLSGPAVGQRLRDYPDLNGQGRFSSDEISRLQEDYARYCQEGRRADLAEEMGRSEQSLSRVAQLLGLTDPQRPKLYQRTWKAMTDAEVRKLFDRLRDSGLTVAQFALQEGLSLSNLQRTMREHLLEEYTDHVQTGWFGDGREFRQGYEFEYRAASWLKELLPQAQVTLSPYSRGVADITVTIGEHVYLIQAKLSGKLEPKPWNELWDAALELGATPLLVERRGGEPFFWLLTGPKSGNRSDRQPRHPVTFDPQGRLTDGELPAKRSP